MWTVFGVIPQDYLPGCFEAGAQGAAVAHGRSLAIPQLARISWHGLQAQDALDRDYVLQLYCLPFGGNVDYMQCIVRIVVVIPYILHADIGLSQAP